MAFSGRASVNDDRISEVYKGEIWSDALQQRARRRIHWLCSQMSGERVIDVGCSQGIAAILLGREGFSVVGVDIQDSRIDYANAELAKEPSETQSLVRFQVGNAADLAFDDDSFDSALLGEVIEHLTNPGRVLRELKRVVRPGGRIALSTPFGLSPHHDHKQTFYPNNLLRLLWGHLVVDSVEIVDHYFRVVCLAQDPTVEQREAFVLESMAVVDGAFAQFDAEWLDTRRSLNAAEKNVAQLNQASTVQAAAHAKALEHVTAERDSLVARKDAELASKTAELVRTKASLEALRSDLQRLERAELAQKNEGSAMQAKSRRRPGQA